MESFTKVLRENRIVDEYDKWSAGGSILVQMGDILDGKTRGMTQFDSRVSDVDILRYLITLREQARDVGGDVKCLVGNHELMNLAKIFAYVAPNDMDTRRNPDVLLDLISKLCEPVIEYGKFIFCHAGISPHLQGVSRAVLLDQNHKMGTVDHRALLMDPIMAGEEGITTTRYYHDQNQDCSRVRTLLNSLSYDRMFIGHNFVSKSISVRCLGRVVLTDTGISRAMTADRSSEIVVIDNDMVYASRAGKLRPI
jgi:hypothetical protein